LIYFYCPDYFPGVSAVFEHASSLGIGKRIALHELNYDVFNSNDLLVFGAWDNELYPMRIRRLKCKKAVLWTSSWGQMSFSPNQVEVHQLEHILNLLKNGKIDALLIGSKEVYEYYKNTLNLYYFPYPFNPELILRYRASEKIPNSVGLFIPPGSRARKNYLNMKIGFELAKRKNPKLDLYTNNPKSLIATKSELNELSEAWLPKDFYYELLSKMVLNLHTTFVESFCYQVAEALFLGTLSLISPCIRDNLNLNLNLDLDFLTVFNLDSPREIVEKIIKIMNLSEAEYKKALAQQESKLKELVIKNNESLKELIECLRQG
jgi:hypothetical protein